MFVDGNWFGMREREETGGSQRAGRARTDMSVNVRTNSEREAAGRTDGSILMYEHYK